MERETRVVSDLKAETCAGKLAQFFPQALPVQIPVQVIPLRPARASLKETAVIEFSSGTHAIFASALPLEFDDRVRIEPRAGGAAADAAVVAVQYHDGRKAVAVQFTSGRRDWMVEP